MRPRRRRSIDRTDEQASKAEQQSLHPAPFPRTVSKLNSSISLHAPVVASQLDLRGLPSSSSRTQIINVAGVWLAALSTRPIEPARSNSGSRLPACLPACVDMCRGVARGRTVSQSWRNQLWTYGSEADARAR
jgi:hypothetical protein